MKIGCKLMAEAYDPHELVRQAVRAEEAGMDFLDVSDHYHPWLYSHGHSPFVWSLLPAIAARTERIELATGVTCPTFRYHPAIIAQAAATTQILAGGRLSLGVGSGERLNEHVTGEGWPSADVRQAMLREAIEVIRTLWRGGYRSHQGRYYTLSDARVFDLPETPPPILVAAGGTRAATLAGEVGDGLFATDPDAEIVAAFARAGGSGPRYCEVPIAFADTEEAAVDAAHRLFRFTQLGWKVMSELPNPINFEAASAHVTRDAMREAFPCGPDLDRHVEVFRTFVDAGFDHFALLPAGPDVDAFFDAFAGDLGERLRAAAAG